MPKVLLGYDDYNGNITTVQCVLREGDYTSTISLKKISLSKDGVVLNSVANPRSGIGPILRIDGGKRNDGNYTCLLEMFFHGRDLHQSKISASSFTRFKGEF